MATKLFQIKAPDFVAGFCVDAKSIVWKAAPKLRWLEEKPLYFVDSYCKKKGWELISLGEVGNEKTPKVS